MDFNLNFKSYLTLYRHPALLVILCFGFASALPVAMMGALLVTRLVEEGFSKETASLMMWLQLPFSLKLLWTPVIDWVSLPWLKSWLGQRASWAIVSLTATMLSLLGVAWKDPSDQLLLFSFFCTLTAIFSGCVYVVGIAYELESIDRSLYAAGSALVSMGYRLGLFVGATGTLYLSDFYSWSLAYGAISLLMCIGIFAILLRGKIPELVRAYDGSLLKSAWASWTYPIKDFVFRPSFIWVLLFMVLYQTGDHLMDLMLNPFLLEIGFTKSQIVHVIKMWGLPFTLTGAFLGGYLGSRFPLLPVLSVLGLVHASTQLLYAFLAQHPQLLLFYVASTLVHLTGGMCMTVFITWLWRLTTPGYATVQYTLLWSLLTFKRSLLAPLSGFLATHLDWALFFITIASISFLAASLPLLTKKKAVFNYN